MKPIAAPVIGAHIESSVTRTTLLDVQRLMALARVRTALARVREQHLVEVLPPHLVGVRRTVADRAIEGEGVVALLVVGLEVRAALVHAQRAHLLQHAEPLEYGQIHRQQRLADVEARMMRLLQRYHAIAAAALLARRGYRVIALEKAH